MTNLNWQHTFSLHDSSFCMCARADGDMGSGNAQTLLGSGNFQGVKCGGSETIFFKTVAAVKSEGQLMLCQ